MATKFMTRVFSAQQNEETELLDQLENDIDIVLEDGDDINDEEYDMTKITDDSVLVNDKVNNELTEVTRIDNSNILSDFNKVKISPLVTQVNGDEVISNYLKEVSTNFAKLDNDKVIPVKSLQPISFSNYKGELGNNGVIKFDLGNHRISIDLINGLITCDTHKDIEIKVDEISQLPEALQSLKSKLGVKSFSK